MTWKDHISEPVLIVPLILKCPFLKPSEWEKIIANEANDNELISKIHKLFIQLSIRKASNPKKKWENTHTDISPKKTCRWLTNT